MFRLVESSKERRTRLEEARKYFQFVQDHEDEEGWLVEKQRICKAGVSAKDLRAVVSLQQKHKVKLETSQLLETNSHKLDLSFLVLQIIIFPNNNNFVYRMTVQYIWFSFPYDC